MRTPARITRRDFNRLAVAGGMGTLLFPALGPALARSALARSETADPHFFLQILLPGGADASYLFDARPLAMTAAGQIQNYIGEDPARWEGSNGQATLATKLTAPLVPFRDRFSVLNGVVMATGFDGHTQNLNFLFAGSPFGGASFVPQLNRAAGRGPLDALQKGTFDAQLSGVEGVVPLSPPTAAKLISSLKAAPPLAADQGLFQFLMGRYQALGAGPGAFSEGARGMAQSFARLPELSGMLKSLQAPDLSDPEPDRVFVKLCLELFRKGTMRGAILALQDDAQANVDAHDPENAKAQPKTYAKIAERLALVFALLRDTQYDATRSFLDVTTVMFSSEFSRTTRQIDKAIDATGTDHNPLTNTVLLGGKGVRGGLVVGASDFQSATEPLSPAHLALDGSKLKAMGRPFDFATLAPRPDLPGRVDLADYLTMSSVVNTLLGLFGAPVATRRTLVRNGAAAPSLRGLLV